MLSHFLAIMKQKCGCYVNVQLLQTLNILFENIRHETSLCKSLFLYDFDLENLAVFRFFIEQQSRERNHNT